MTAEAMQAVQPRMEKMMATVMDDAEKMAKEASADAKDAKTAK
jgi:membrane protein insertase Oxa1/YidC/SpoIIIJ